MKTKFLALLLAAAALALPSLHAQEVKPVRGVVSVVVGTTVTIGTNKQGEMAYATSAQTRILKLDGKAGQLSDLAPGATVLVTTGSNANQASEIRIVEPKVKYEKEKKP